MDTRRIAIAAAFVLLAGCRMDPNQLLVERELRLQEDEIYRLRNTVRDYQFALAACQQENAGLRRQLGLPQHAPAGSSVVDPPAAGPAPEVLPAPVPEPAPPEVILPPGVQTVPGDQTQDSPGTTAPATAPAAGHVGAAFRKTTSALATAEAPGPALSGPSDAWSAGAASTSLATGDSAQVVRIVLLGAATGGYDADGQPGDEGISVAIQPADQYGRLVEAPAEVAVVVLDPAEVGQAARVARWDLPADLTAACFCQVGNTRAMKLDLAWPGDPPKHGLLHVFVRYTTRDGRHLKVDRQIRITLPNKASGQVAGWTPRREPRTEGSAQAPTASSSQSQNAVDASRIAGTPNGRSGTSEQASVPRLASQSADSGRSGTVAGGTSPNFTDSAAGATLPMPPKPPPLPRPVWSPYRP